MIKISENTIIKTIGSVIVLLMLIVCFLFCLTGCQNIQYKEYYQNGKLKKKYSQNGNMNWASGKKFSINLVGN